MGRKTGLSKHWESTQEQIWQGYEKRAEKARLGKSAGFYHSAQSLSSIGDYSRKQSTEE
jgi:hypothetical protein